MPMKEGVQTRLSKQKKSSVRLAFYLVELCQMGSVNCLVPEDSVHRKVLCRPEAFLR